MKQSGHLNPSEETGTGCHIISNYGRTPPNKHGGVDQQQQHWVVDLCQDLGLGRCWCVCVLILCVYGRSRYLYIMLGGYRRI